LQSSHTTMRYDIINGIYVIIFLFNILIQMEIETLTWIIEEQKLNIPQTIIDTFIEHYKNQDTWLCCCNITAKLHGENFTKDNWDNVVKAIKNLDEEYYTISNAWDSHAIKKSGRQKKTYLVSYDGFKIICAQRNATLIKYYLTLEKLWFKVTDRINSEKLETMNKMIEE
jgi:hypothetical protein